MWMRRLACVAVVLSAVGCAADPTSSAETTGTVEPVRTDSPTVTDATVPDTPEPDITPTAPDATTTTTAAERPLLAFETADDIDGWSTVNDPVMGGRSTSTVTWRDGLLVFGGDVSLENNGGFASLRAPDAAIPAGAWARRDGVHLVGVGDGKTYLLQLAVGPTGESYVQRFVADGPFDVLLAFDAFVATTRFLEPVTDAPTLAPADIEGLAVFILDEQVGPFELGLAAIG